MDEPAPPHPSGPPRGFGLPGEALRGEATAPGRVLPPDVGARGPRASRVRAAVAVGALGFAAIGAVALVVGLLTAEEPERRPREEVQDSVAAALDAGGSERAEIVGERPFTAAQILACEVDVRAYRTAIATFIALEGRDPASEDDLLAEDLIDEPSAVVDVQVVDGSAVAVPTPGSPCDG